MKLCQLMNANTAKEMAEANERKIAMPFLEFMFEEIAKQLSVYLQAGRYEMTIEIKVPDNHPELTYNFTIDERYDILARVLEEKGYQCEPKCNAKKIKISWE